MSARHVHRCPVCYALMFCVGCERRAKKGLLAMAKEAHEAACEAARREERERVLAEVEAYAARAAKRIAQADPHSWAGGRSGAFAEIAEAVRTMGEEKGQAK